MDIFWKLINTMYYYKKDQAAGRPYWCDTKLMGLVVGMVATEIGKYCGVQIDSELQIKIVAAAVGLGALFDSKTGIQQDPTEKAAERPIALYDPRHSRDSAALLTNAPPQTSAAVDPNDPNGLNRI